MKFLKDYLKKDNYIYFLYLILLLLLFLFSKEWIVINAEFLIGLSFLILFYFLQKFLSSLLIFELDSINLNLKEQFLILYKSKLKIQKKLLYLFKKKIKLYKFLKRVTYRVEDQLELIGLRRSLITKENYSSYAKFMLISFIIRYNYKLHLIYNFILDILNKKIYS